jgi:hypothetical protein
LFQKSFLCAATCGASLGANRTRADSQTSQTSQTIEVSEVSEVAAIAAVTATGAIAVAREAVTRHRVFVRRNTLSLRALTAEATADEAWPIRSCLLSERLHQNAAFSSKFNPFWSINSEIQKSYSIFRNLCDITRLISLREGGRFGRSSPSVRRDAMDAVTSSDVRRDADG